MRTTPDTDLPFEQRVSKIFPQGWGVNAQTGVLTDVLLGKPDHFRWVALNSISAVTLANQEQMGYRFDQQKAMQQHRKMVDVYERAGVRCHFAEADEGLAVERLHPRFEFHDAVGRRRHQHPDAAAPARLCRRVRVL